MTTNNFHTSKNPRLVKYTKQIEHNEKVLFERFKEILEREKL